MPSSVLQALTWLPSFCQKMAGGGCPVVLHWKVTLLPCVVIWSRGFEVIWGGTGRGKEGVTTQEMNAPAVSLSVLCF